MSDGWTFEEEQELIDSGICPECGADIDVCGHYDDPDDYEAHACPYCHGTGQDWDYMPCGHCDGEGYEWWL
jgi:hypothetical protein